MFKYLYYGLFIAWLRIKGVKWNYLNKKEFLKVPVVGYWISPQSQRFQ